MSINAHVPPASAVIATLAVLSWTVAGNLSAQPAPSAQAAQPAAPASSAWPAQSAGPSEAAPPIGAGQFDTAPPGAEAPAGEVVPTPLPPQTVPQTVASPSALSPAASSSDTLSAAQLDQLTAPIALYPDALLGSILMAATYPLEVVEAHRWLEDSANAALRGNQLIATLQPEPWDLSVKSLVPFPQVLQMMDDNLEWTERLGDAFLAQQAAVMDSIQRLRQRAAATGSLRSTPQQNVSTIGGDIDIDPAGADVAYVPYYDPDMAYGAWPWPDDPPIAFPLPPGIDIALGATVLGFGPAMPIIAPLWGWQHWHWRRHLLEVGSLVAPAGLRPWQHDPVHRRGVPYRNPAVASRYEALSEAARLDLRGYPPSAAISLTGTGRNALQGRRRPRERLPTERTPPQPPFGPTPPQPPSPQRYASAPMFEYRPAAPVAPLLESFDEGARARADAARGVASRAESFASASAPMSRGAGPRR